MPSRLPRPFEYPNMRFVSDFMKTFCAIALAWLLGCGSTPEPVEVVEPELPSVRIHELEIYPGRDAVRSGAIDFGASMSARIESAEAVRGIYGEPAVLIRFAAEDVAAVRFWTAARKEQTIAITFEEEVLLIATLEGRLGAGVTIPLRRPYSDETPAQAQARLVAALHPK